MKKYVFLLIILLIVIGFFFYVKEAGYIPENFTENEQEKIQESSLTRQEIMEDVAERIAEISPVEPVLGGNWYVTRFWFIEGSNENFYVEYEDGHILQRVLLNVEKKEDKLSYKVIGYFEPGETNWILKKGEDKFFGRELDLYEREGGTGGWVKKN